ncbi:MAG: sugar phosphate nucleotidyltransferase [Patescibacteria group bacterium]|jgi:glucose-1-phosphate thymidylyltransferase
MKGIILAGGYGTRLMPCTKVTNKHLLPVYDKPMILYPLETLIAAGIKDIMIVSGTGHAGHFLELLGSGRDLGIRLSYAVQEKAGGIAEALGLCEDFADNDKLAVILGDNIFTDQVQIKKAVEDFSSQEKGAKILIKEVPDPKRFGVAELSGDKVISIEEKPENPKSNFAVTGFYCYDSEVWNIIKTLKPSGRGELEITDVNNHYLATSILTYEMYKDEWTDAGTFESLLKASNIIANRAKLV